MTIDLFEEMDLRRKLKIDCAAAGGHAAYARARGLSVEEVIAVCEGNDAPGKRICRALGFLQVTRYMREEP